MILHENIAVIAGFIGDKTRSSILVSLMEGGALTAGELALRANISPQTASNHLAKLINAKLICCESAGRHRYYRISSPLVAQALEALSLLTDNTEKKPPRHENLHKDICFARTCYDHLAGELGVKITSALLKERLIKHNNQLFAVTTKGRQFFADLGIDVSELIKLRRQFAKPCLDWTEREYHLAGSLGSSLLEYMVDARLVLRSRKKRRILLLTAKGQIWLREKLSI